jgi:hypothetical protein
MGFRLLPCIAFRISKCFAEIVRTCAAFPFLSYSQHLSSFSRAHSPRFYRAITHGGPASRKIAFMPGMNESAREKFNQAVGLSHAGKIAEAITAFREALAADPSEGLIHFQLGVALEQDRQLTEAETAYRGAIRQGFLKAHLQLGKLLLITGRWEEGWKEMQWWEPAVHGAKRFREPQWDGKAAPGKTLLLSASWGGFGDTIHFIRFLPILRDKGMKLIVECQEQLIPLLAPSYPTEQFVATGKPLPRFDMYLRLESLPWALGITEQNLPKCVPYLSAPAERRDYWAGKIPTDGRKKVCAVWEGKTIRDVRETPRNVDGIRLFGLGEFAIRDFADTAAIVEQMDLVVTVDTAMGHLAGAMNKPVWVLVPWDGDWRWGLNRSDTPWYPTMRLFRQPRQGDWKTPIEDIVRELRSL